MIKFIISIVLIICILVVYNYNMNNQNQNNNKITNHVESSQVAVNHFEPRILLSSLQHGFHDNFANNNKLLGWRHWYLKNKSNYQVEPTGNFDGIVTRNYLDNMDNLNDWFNKLYSDDIESKIIE